MPSTVGSKDCEASISVVGAHAGVLGTCTFSPAGVTLADGMVTGGCSPEFVSGDEAVSESLFPDSSLCSGSFLAFGGGIATT